MIYTQKKIPLFIVLLILLGSCSNKVNTWSNRQFHMATTRWNVLFNAKESFKKGQERIRTDFIEDFDELLPVYRENKIEVRQRAEEHMKRVVDKMVKAIELHSITTKPKRKKGKRDSEKYREFRRKKEYNNLIDECYLLLGKGQFYRREYYSTERTFRYIMRTYKDMPIYYETAIWYARTLAEQNKLFRALRTLNDVMKDDNFPKELLSMAYTAKVDFLIRQEKYKKAIEPLESLVTNIKKKEDKTRMYYLLAQLYTKQNQLEKAQETYRRLLAIHPDNKYAFQASLSGALLYEDVEGETGKNDVVVRQLKKLTRDGRNQKFLDEVYFTLGKVYEKRGEVDLAIKNYELSVAYNKENEKQKVKSLMALAEINFNKKKDYVAALKSYELVQNAIEKEDEKGTEISLRIEGLKKLSKKLGVVKMQDSLQRIAKMPSLKREQFIRNLLLSEKKANKKRSRSERKRLNQAIKTVNRPIGDWYFYNSLVVSSGIREFEQKWGKIALTDDWTREKEPLRIKNGDDEKSKTEDNEKVFSTYLDYVEKLPLTPQKMKASTKKIIESLYDIGLIYEEELSDYPKAIDAFKKLLSYKPQQEKYLINGNYHLFLLNTLQGNTAEANVYKERIVTEFPHHRLTNILKDPAYYAKLEKMGKDAELLYQKAYDAYQKYDYENAKLMIKEGIEKYKNVVWYDKFLLLDAMIISKEGSVDEFENALDKILKETTSKSLSELVLSMKKQLKSGKAPNKKINKDVKEWTISDFASMKRDVVADSVNEDIMIDVNIPKVYKNLENEKHYLAIILPRDMKGDILDRLNKFTAKQNNGNKLSVSRRGFGLNTDIILIEALDGKDEALLFLKKILPEQDAIMRGVNQVDYKIVLIADSNLRKLTVDKSIDEYSDFYEENYSAEKQAEQGDGSTAKSVDKIEKKKEPYKGIFKYDKKDKYDFVLLVPKKGVDVNYLWTALHNFNKKYKVKKDSFGKMRMLVVQNIGDEKEAMQYLEKVIGVKYIYGVIENVDYRNFIISKENMKLLQSSQNIDEYIVFFKTQFL